MNLLMLILSVVMTWTVETKSSVSGDGTYPASMSVTYSCSYQKGTVRKDDVAMISFSNMGGMTIEQIEVYVRSNKSAGSGIFTVEANESTIASKSGSLKDWTGSYDNVNYYPVPLLQEALNNVNTLSVSLTGTVNSLYIEKYVIQYTPVSPRSVTLMKGNTEYITLTEQSGGSGVMLPSLEKEGNWRFVAWSKQHFYAISTMPDSWIIPGKYYPTENETLWAVYSYEKTIESAFVSTLESGYYLYADSTKMRAMRGAVEEGFAECATVNISDESQIYEITFDNACETATIYHPYSNSYIGSKGLALSNEATPWQVWHRGNATAFYTQIGNKSYVLWPNYLRHISQDEDIFCTALIQTEYLSSATTVLISADALMEEPVLTCHPEKGLSIENTVAPDKNEYVLPLGNYRLIIRNGQKTMHIQ